jgi:glycosyltransferase involved in cell wall biosynthesis
MNYPLDISVVVPLYNEDESLGELIQWIDKVMVKNDFSYEVILVDDGSIDTSWEVIESLHQKFSSVKGIRFRRNYGKSAALHSAFQEVVGRVVITMDADLQDSPDEIPGLYRMVTEEQFDLVSGWKKKRHDPLGKTIPSKFFNWVTRRISKIELNDFNCGLKAYRVEVVKAIEVYGEMHRYIPLLAKWAGFYRIGEKVVEHRARKFGVSKFGFERFLNGFLDLLSITFMGKFSKSPMHFFGSLGTLLFGIGFVSAGYLGVRKLIFMSQGYLLMKLTDNPFFYLSLTCMILGTQLFLSGFISELISRNSGRSNEYGILKTIGIDGKKNEIK